MVKIFLVEDEKIVREGIKREIPWGEYGMELVGEAADGELAYPLIQQTKPDILLTDIRMPFMDGLALAELVKKEMPDIRIVFLSGYDDFEYAKKAIHIGASDYLLKPISSEQLLTALEQMNEQITQMKSDKEYMEQFKKELEEQKMWERERLFDEIIRGENSLSELLIKAKEYNLDFTATAYNIVLFQFQNPSQNRELSGTINEAYGKIKMLLQREHAVIGFDRSLEGMAFIIKADRESELDKIVENWVMQLEELAKACQGLSYFGAVGIKAGRFSEIKESYRVAGKSFAYRYMTEESKFLGQMETAGQGSANSADGNEVIKLDMSGFDKNILERFLKTSSVEAGDYFIEDYVESLNKNMESLMFRQYILMDSYVAISRYLTQIGITRKVLDEEFPAIDSVLKETRSVIDTKAEIKKLLKLGLILRESVSQKRYSQLLAQAKDYIDHNFHREGISLSAVASEVNLSSSHFSAIFSQEMGITFVEYLTFVRMEQAKQLLRFTDSRTSEIAYQVGYKDPHYFSYLFKKTQGITPKQYRGKGA